MATKVFLERKGLALVSDEREGLVLHDEGEENKWVNGK